MHSKIVQTHQIYFDITRKNQFDQIVTAYKKLGPSLSRQIFCKFFENKNFDFGKFIWFLHYFVWDLNTLQCCITSYLPHSKLHYDSKSLTNWISNYHYHLSEARFFGCNYLNGQMYFALLDKCLKSNSPNYKVFKLNPKEFSYQSKTHLKSGENLNKLLKLTVMSCDLLDFDDCYIKLPVFFDLNKVIAFSFKRKF